MKLLFPVLCILMVHCSTPVQPAESEASTTLQPAEALTDGSDNPILQKSVTLDFTNAPLAQIFKEIEEQVNCHFSGICEVRDGAGTFTINCKNMPLEECLNRISSQNKTIKFRFLQDQNDKTTLLVYVDDVDF